MKTLLTMMAAAMMMVSCGAKTVEKVENYDAKDFVCINMEGVGKIVYTQGDYNVRAEGDSLFIANTSVDVKDGNLSIKLIKDVKKNDDGVTFYISSPTLMKVECGGVGSFEIKEPVNFDNDFAFELEGVGAVKIKDLTCQNFKFDQDGVGASEVSVKCNNAKYASSGVGACKLNVEAETLDITSDGVGAVEVKGHVKHYNKQKSGFVSAIKDKGLVVEK